ncbi:hypothetical protein CYMTET_36318, partial [Cymbomonas tetramitiformis]
VKLLDQLMAAMQDQYRAWQDLPENSDDTSFTRALAEAWALLRKVLANYSSEALREDLQLQEVIARRKGINFFVQTATQTGRKPQRRASFIGDVPPVGSLESDIVSAPTEETGGKDG